MSFSSHYSFKKVVVALCAITFFSCGADRISTETVNWAELYYVMDALNRSVGELRSLVAEYENNSTILLLADQSRPSGETYLFQVSSGATLSIGSEIRTKDYPIPDLSVGEDHGTFYWVLDGDWIITKNKSKVNVLDKASEPHFFVKGSDLFYSLGSLSPEVKVKADSRNVVQVAKYDYDADNNRLRFVLSSKLVLDFPLYGKSSVLKNKVLNQAYYKDVFLDAGIGLTSRKALSAAKYLGLSLEGISFSRSEYTEDEVKLQTAIIAGDPLDSNGRLIYPDGQPRYRLLFVNGGSSKTHGESLPIEALDNMRSFVQNGGSYVGTCAGAFFASNGYDDNENYPHYLSIWPGMMRHTGLSNVYTGMTIEKKSQLLNYYDFGGDFQVDSVRHNAGGYPVTFPEGTEVQGRYIYPENKDVDGKPSIWSYKKDGGTGRIVLEGSHPEEVRSGERLDLTVAMVQFALDGRGYVPLKGFLNNGVPREMMKRTDDKDPAYSVIGDRQVHHFAVLIPKGVKNVSFELDGNIDCDMALMMSRDTYAFPESADYLSSEAGAHQKLFFPELEEGICYVSVQCLTTVTTEATDYGQKYTGNTEVLNGVPYRIKATWE